MYYKKLKTQNSNLKISHENKIYTENNRAHQRTNFKMVDCTICLLPIKEGEDNKTLACGHQYHTTCLKPWLKNNSTCPTCRGEVNKHEITSHFTPKRNAQGQLHCEDGPAVKDDDIEEWYINGQYHREDGPALITESSEEWYQHGKLHRVGGPARTIRGEINGTEEWYINGELHREDGPAHVSPRNIKWYKHGQLHRENGPAWKNDGINIWYYEGKRHRVGGPAVISFDCKYWYQNGVLHREDGPAEINADSERYYYEGRPHREGGPAVVYKHFQGCDEYWRHGMPSKA